MKKKTKFNVKESTKRIKKIKNKIEIPVIQDYYCKNCGTCGFIGCCGVKSFLEEHVRGKTNCPNEGLVIDQIIEIVDLFLRGN